MDLNTKDFRLILDNLKTELRDKIKSKNIFNENWLDRVMNVENDSRTKNGVCRDYVEKYGTLNIIDSYIRKSQELSDILSEYRNLKYDDNKEKYEKVYDNVCEKMAEIKLFYEILEYLYNSDIISEYYENKYNIIRNDVNTNQLKLDL